MGEPRIPILCYHRVCPKNDPEYRAGSLAVAPEQFARQMSLLKRLGYAPISLQDLSAHLLCLKNLPPKPVAITFDDGYEDNYHYAFPILRRHGFIATIFLVTGQLDGWNVWDSGRTPLLKRAQILEMHEAGILFGSHTDHHIDMTAAPADAVRRELEVSKRKVEELTGRLDVPFCYPYTRVSGAARDWVRQAGYSCAVSGDHGSGDPFQLLRIQVFPSTGLFQFWKKIQPWYPAWLKYQQKRKAAEVRLGE